MTACFWICSAGSGGIGIEALSSGAREAVFVENNPKAMACIKENLKIYQTRRQGGYIDQRCHDGAVQAGR